LSGDSLAQYSVKSQFEPFTPTLFRPSSEPQESLGDALPETLLTLIRWGDTWLIFGRQRKRELYLSAGIPGAAEADLAAQVALAQG